MVIFMSDESAQSSGGPQSPEGKSVVKLNAVKHGILSDETILRRGELKESREEYELLRDQLLEELAPEGMVETMLVASNIIVKDQEVAVTYQEPFASLAKFPLAGISTLEREKALSVGQKSDLFERWLLGLGSNQRPWR